MASTQRIKAPSATQPGCGMLGALLMLSCPRSCDLPAPSVLSLCCSPLLYLCRNNGASRGSFDVQANGAAPNFTPSSVTQPSSGYSDLWREVAAGKEKLWMGGCCSSAASQRVSSLLSAFHCHLERETEILASNPVGSVL